MPTHQFLTIRAIRTAWCICVLDKSTESYELKGKWNNPIGRRDIVLREQTKNGISFRRGKLLIGKYLTKVMPSVMEAIRNRCARLNYEELTDFLLKASQSETTHSLYNM